MSTTFKNQMRDVMNDAWRMFRVTGEAFAECLKKAIHNVSPQTVRNYINDGLISPELRTIENGKFNFRLSYVLTLDFSELKRKLKDRNYQ